MKKHFLVLTLLPLMYPLTAPAEDMMLAVNMRGLPEDFRQYFYDAELVVQVYLNDTRLFDAAVSLRKTETSACFVRLTMPKILTRRPGRSGPAY